MSLCWGRHFRFPLPLQKPSIHRGWISKTFSFFQASFGQSRDLLSHFWSVGRWVCFVSWNVDCCRRRDARFHSIHLCSNLDSMVRSLSARLKARNHRGNITKDVRSTPPSTLTHSFDLEIDKTYFNCIIFISINPSPKQ